MDEGREEGRETRDNRAKERSESEREEAAVMERPPGTVRCDGGLLAAARSLVD